MRAFRWTPETEAFLRANADILPAEEMAAQLRERLDRAPTAPTIRAWFKRHGVPLRNHNIKYEWDKPDIVAMLSAAWFAGVPSTRMADMVAEATGDVPEARAVMRFCLRRWGARSERVAGKREAETRRRRCCRCREWHELPRFVFTCDPCRRLAPIHEAPEAYALVGARMR